MNQQSLARTWDHIRLLNGIAFRAIDALPENAIDAHPIPGMRTPKELLVHLYSTVIRGMPEAVTRGEAFDEEGEGEARKCAAIPDKAALVKFCRECWDAGDREVKQITDAKLQAMVKTPWGRDMAGEEMIRVVPDEMLHHRGQLFVYLRVLGVTPPEMWDFSQNAPEFQRKPQTQTA